MRGSGGDLCPMGSQDPSRLGALATTHPEQLTLRCMGPIPAHRAQPRPGLTDRQMREGMDSRPQSKFLGC